MESKIAILEAENAELKMKMAELTTECDILREQLAKVGALGDSEKKRLLEKILKAHPNCFNQNEFDEAFNEATRK
jgi:hypothetical protein